MFMFRFINRLLAEFLEYSILTNKTNSIRLLVHYRTQSLNEIRVIKRRMKLHKFNVRMFFFIAARQGICYLFRKIGFPSPWRTCKNNIPRFLDRINYTYYHIILPNRFIPERYKPILFYW